MRSLTYACTHVRSCISKPTKICETSGKIIHLNEYGCRDAPCEKSWKQGNPLSNTIKDFNTIMLNPSLHNSSKGLLMIVLVSLIVLLRGFPCFQDFSHGPSHPYISIFPLVYVHLLHDLQQHTPNVTYVLILCCN